MNEEESRGRLIAHAMHSELEEIEKVAFLSQTLQATRRTGGQWIKGLRNKGMVKRVASTGKKGTEEYKKGGWKVSDKAGIGDLAKYYAGRGMANHPGAVAGGVGTVGALGAGRLLFGG